MGCRAGVMTLAAAAVLAPLLAACGRKPVGRRMPGDEVVLEIQGRKLRVEVASDDLTRQNGLMFRESLEEDAGMLFVYAVPEKLSFWMRNTLIPLSIAFIDDGGTILEIRDMRPKDESPTRSMYRVRYALEVNQGWFQRNGVDVGDAFADFAETIRDFHPG